MRSGSGGTRSRSALRASLSSLSPSSFVSRSRVTAICRSASLPGATSRARTRPRSLISRTTGWVRSTLRAVTISVFAAVRSLASALASKAVPPLGGGMSRLSRLSLAWSAARHWSTRSPLVMVVPSDLLSASSAVLVPRARSSSEKPASEKNTIALRADSSSRPCSHRSTSSFTISACSRLPDRNVAPSTSTTRRPPSIDTEHRSSATSDARVAAPSYFTRLKVRSVSGTIA